jgi:MSHA pilin protein MshC
MNRASGFTMVELIMVIVILGILSVVAIPRMDTSGYRALQFHDQTVAALRYAQKTATSHRRMVCVAFTNSPPETKVALTIDHDKSGACDGHVLPLPDGSPSVSTTSAAFDSLPADFNFGTDGTAVDPRIDIDIDGQTRITVVGATGHVQ